MSGAPMRRWLAWACLGGVLLSSVTLAQERQPLTLQAALQAADGPHPDLLAAEADRDVALADQSIASSRQDLSVALEAALRAGKPTVGDSSFTNDNSIRLTARKSLYDFGRTGLAEQAAGAEVAARDAVLISVRDRRRIEIMSRFFDVLLADMQFAADNEFMAVAYVDFDHAKDRVEVGQLANVDLAALEALYQDTFLKRNASLKRQRITRALLANAMNRPSDLPEDLEDPKLPDNDRPLPDYETLLPVMLANNPSLRAQQDLLVAAQKRLEAVRAENGPTLDAELQAADWHRSATTRDNVSAGLVLNWPIYQGRRVDARIDREQAQFHKLQAGMEKLKMDLTQALLEAYMEADQQRNTARGAAKVQSNYRDLLLERARGQYEVELKTDLGNSMAETVEAKLRQRKAEYQLALALARLEALVGKPLSELQPSKAAAN
jgi:outer membrane protein TolC